MQRGLIGILIATVGACAPMRNEVDEPGLSIVKECQISEEQRPSSGRVLRFVSNGQQLSAAEIEILGFRSEQTIAESVQAHAAGCLARESIDTYRTLVVGTRNLPLRGIELAPAQIPYTQAITVLELEQAVSPFPDEFSRCGSVTLPQDWSRGPMFLLKLRTPALAELHNADVRWHSSDGVELRNLTLSSFGCVAVPANSTGVVTVVESSQRLGRYYSVAEEFIDPIDRPNLSLLASVEPTLMAECAIDTLPAGFVVLKLLARKADNSLQRILQHAIVHASKDDSPEQSTGIDLSTQLSALGCLRVRPQLFGTKYLHISWGNSDDTYKLSLPFSADLFSTNGPMMREAILEVAP